MTEGMNYICNEHGEGVLVVFPMAYGKAGCPVCEMVKKIEQLEDELEEPYEPIM